MRVLRIRLLERVDFTSRRGRDCFPILPTQAVRPIQLLASWSGDPLNPILGLYVALSLPASSISGSEDTEILRVPNPSVLPHRPYLGAEVPWAALSAPCNDSADIRHAEHEQRWTHIDLLHNNILTDFPKFRRRGVPLRGNASRLSCKRLIGIQRISANTPSSLPAFFARNLKKSSQKLIVQKVL